MSPPQGSFPRFSRLDQVPDNSLCKQAEPLLHSTNHFLTTHIPVSSPGGYEPQEAVSSRRRNGFTFAPRYQEYKVSSHTCAERAEKVTKLCLPALRVVHVTRLGGGGAEDLSVDAPEPTQGLTHRVVKGLESALGASPGYSTYKPCPWPGPSNPVRQLPQTETEGSRLSPSGGSQESVCPD